MMGDVIRFLISNDSAIDNMTEEDILELATFGDDYIPNDIENLFADFCPGFEERKNICQIYLMKKIWMNMRML